MVLVHVTTVPCHIIRQLSTSAYCIGFDIICCHTRWGDFDGSFVCVCLCVRVYTGNEVEERLGGPARRQAVVVQAGPRRTSAGSRSDGRVCRRSGPVVRGAYDTASSIQYPVVVVNWRQMLNARGVGCLEVRKRCCLFLLSMYNKQRAKKNA